MKNPFVAAFNSNKKEKKSAKRDPEQRSIASNKSSEDFRSKYDVIEELGRGGFAVVHRAHKKGEAAGTEIAMRICPLELVRKDPTFEGIESLRRRLQWARDIPKTYQGRVSNAHILYLDDFSITKTDLITFTEVCNGGDLFDRILNSPGGCLPEEEAKEGARALCQAIEQVHHVGAIHRDVKPENVLLRKKGDDASKCVLTDFGCAITFTTPDAYHRGSAGSPGYLAPEMVAGQPYNMLVDEWSLGVTVYEMLTGRSPMVSQTPEELARETLEREIPYPARYWSKLSPEAKDFTRRLLTKDPRHRMRAEDAPDHPWLKGGPHRQSSLMDTVDSPVDHTAPVVLRKTLKSAMSTRHGGMDALGIATSGLTLDNQDISQFDTADLLAGKISAVHTSRLHGIESSDSGGTARMDTSESDGTLGGK